MLINADYWKLSTEHRTQRRWNRQWEYPTVRIEIIELLFHRIFQILEFFPFPSRFLFRYICSFLLIVMARKFGDSMKNDLKRHAMVGFFGRKAKDTLMDTLSLLMALLRGIRRWRAGAYRALQNAYDATADDFIEAKETCWKKCYCDAPVYLCVRSLINSNNSGAPRGSSHFPQPPSPRISLLTRIEFARTFDDHAIKFTRNE